MLCYYGSSHQKCSVKEDVLEGYVESTGEHMCQGLFFGGILPKYV